MKNYKYTCRNKSGTLRRGQLEASDRADALRQLKSQGDLPLSISEGSLAMHPQKKTHFAAVIAATVLISVLVAILFTRNTSKTRPEPDTTTSGKAIAANHKPSQKNIPPQVLPQTAESEERSDDSSHVSVPSTVQRVDNTLQAKDNPEEMPTVIEEEKPDSTLRTQTEKMLSLMASLPPGTEIPPMPILPGMENDFIVAQTNIIVIHADDTDEMAERKEKIAWLKQDITTLVQEGKSPSEAIKLIEENANRVAKIRSEFQQYATALYREGKKDEAMAFIDEANEELRQYGVEPVRLSPRLTRTKGEK